MAIEDVMKYIATNEIKWIDLQFFDLFGTMHRVSISRNDLEESSFTKESLPQIFLRFSERASRAN